MKADCPYDVHLDIRALKHAKLYGKNISAQELYSKIPIIHPTVTKFVEPVNAELGYYRWTDQEAFENLPKWSWNQIYTFAGVEPPPKAQKKGKT